MCRKYGRTALRRRHCRAGLGQPEIGEGGGSRGGSRDRSSARPSTNDIRVSGCWQPARATRAYKELMSDAAPRLDGVEFGVLALGDTAYVEFCAIGKALDERLAALGAKRSP